MRTIRSVCRMCHGGCGVLIDVANDRVVEVRGDPEHPMTRGFTCPKGRAAPALVHHPHRLMTPLRRIGPKGSTEFAKITWEAAFEEVTDRLAQCMASVPESVVLSQGTDRNYQEWLFRFGNAFGTPNVLGPAHICFYPKMMGSIMTLGDLTFPDYDGNPECIVIWGSNKIACHSDGVIGTGLMQAMKAGSQLIVIDPKRTALARRARYWLRPKPGSDAALALGIIRVILDRDLEDRAFIEAHTQGARELAEHVRAYTSEKVEELTWVPAKLMEEAAMFYARASAAAIEIGTGIEQSANAFAAIRAIRILSGICGNIDRRGGDVIWEPTGIIGRRDFPARGLLPEIAERKRLGSGEHRLLSMAGWAHPNAVWNAILHGEPYPVSAMLVFGSNLLTLYANAARVRQALEAIPFLMVADLFLTPTARMADIVLPVTTWVERDQIVEFNSYLAARRKAFQVGQCKSDEEIINTLAQRLGLGEHFWHRADDSLNARLRPIGLNWERLCELAYVANPPRYQKFRSGGFRTRDGLFHITSPALQSMGYSSLPCYQEPKSADRYEFLLTSAHSPFFFNSEFHNLPELRRRQPEPVAELHPRAASRHGLKEGMLAAISANGAQALFRVQYNEHLDERVIYAPASWWDPEDAAWPRNWTQSNVNMLTTDTPANPEMGAPQLRGVPCALRAFTPPGAARVSTS
uniref:Anaerobic selenocysteine-containing dehydrogenase n=1 Tax=Candidatus Kentrum sp. DK TaxID=2126562 RepID=A0A450S389_9GAMM|nr:MAG: Anaerobic selenocysteine-containing dehydrogenase [Candidatus Kentron sp. DK]